MERGSTPAEKVIAAAMLALIVFLNGMDLVNVQWCIPAPGAQDWDTVLGTPDATESR